MRNSSALQVTFGGGLDSNEFYTPPDLVDRVRIALGGPIALDPAWHPDSFTDPLCGIAQDENHSTHPEYRSGDSWHWPVATDLAGSPIDTRESTSRSIAGFLNPPYSRGAVAPYLEQVSKHTRDHKSHWIVLLKCDPSTRWFHRWIWPDCFGAACAVSFLRRRVRFCHRGKPATGGAKWPCVVAMFGNRGTDARTGHSSNRLFHDAFGGEFGRVVDDS